MPLTLNRVAAWYFFLISYKLHLCSLDPSSRMRVLLPPTCTGEPEQAAEQGQEVHPIRRKRKVQDLQAAGEACGICNLAGKAGPVAVISASAR